MIKNFGRYVKQEPHDLIYYYVNEDVATIQEFIDMEHDALDFVSFKKYRLFKTYDTQIDYVFIGKN